MASITRRDFCALAAAAACVPDVRGLMGRAGPPGVSPQRTPVLPRIEFGGTGLVLPRLAMGCAPIGKLADPREAVEIMLKAIALGVRHFDTAHIYGSGNSEKFVGAAIAASGIDRSEFYVSTKTTGRDKASALQDLDISLQRLRMDYVDAWQVHSLTFDPEPLFQPGTVIEAMEEAREQGRVRYIGITSHELPANMIRAIQMYPFDVVLIPLNPVSTQYLDEFLPLAMEKNIGVVVMKPYGQGRLFREYTARQLLQFVLEKPGVHIVAPGLDAKWQVDDAFQGVAG